MSRHTLGTALLTLFSLAPSMQAQAADPERGKAVFNRWCAGCHAGTSRFGGLSAGSYVLQQRYQGTKPADLEQRTDLLADYIKLTVRHGVNVMPRTRKTEISDQDLDNLVSYLTRTNR
jgi:(+)-pinoresinol hydroxylase